MAPLATILSTRHGSELVTVDASKAVFVSYASQDVNAALRICKSLRAAGIEVWFDQSELRGGDAWDQKIRRQIRECALFVPLVSTNTQTRQEGYFRLEWRLADQRTHLMARNKAFVVPVAIDGTTEPDSDVPESFVNVQWVRLPCGEAPPSFCARIKALLGDASEPNHPHATTNEVAPLLSDKSIAVLPFVDLSERKDQEYFSDGLSEELIHLLTKVPNLKVSARTSSFYFKGQHATIATIAKTLSVTHVLEGSVRKAGNTIRVMAQLVCADNGYHLWSETYDRNLEDVFKVQDEIAGAVVAALRVQLLLSVRNLRRTASSSAYNQYLLGKHFFNRPTRDGPRLAVDAYRKAIEIDPDFAAAYAALAEAQSLTADARNDTTGQQRALADAERAVALAPDLEDAYAARGRLRYVYSWDWAGVRSDLQKALALDPGRGSTQTRYAELLSTVGPLPDAVTAARKAVATDPLSELASRRLGQFLYYGGQIAEARQVLSQALAVNPDSIYLRWHLGVAELLDGHAQLALDVFRKNQDSVFRLTGVALAEHALEHAGESEAALVELIGRNAEQAATFQICENYAWRGDLERAFEWLERAYAQRDGGLVFIKYDPLLDALRGDPRFAALLRKMALPG